MFKKIISSMLVFASTLACASDLMLISPTAPSGLKDHVVKSVQPYLAKELNRDVIITYNPGSKGKIARQQLLQNTQAGIDSIMLDEPGSWINNEDPNYIPISYYGATPAVIIARKDWKEPPELKNCQLKSQLTYGTAGVMSPTHLLMELQSKQCKSMFTHVPYKGGAPAMIDLLGGHIDLAVLAWATAKPFVESGELKVLYSIGPVTIPEEKWRPWQPKQYQTAPNPMALFFFMRIESDPQLREQIAKALERTYSRPSFIKEQKPYGLIRQKVNMSVQDQFNKYLQEITKAVNKN